VQIGQELADVCFLCISQGGGSCYLELEKCYFATLYTHCIVHLDTKFGENWPRIGVMLMFLVPLLLSLSDSAKLLGNLTFRHMLI